MPQSNWPTTESFAAPASIYNTHILAAPAPDVLLILPSGRVLNPLVRPVGAFMRKKKRGVAAGRIGAVTRRANRVWPRIDDTPAVQDGVPSNA